VVVAVAAVLTEPRYRTPELNVQNGVLKSLSFLFEYIQEMGKDYVYAVTPLLEDALMDRDLVSSQHRRLLPRALQAGCSCVLLRAAAVLRNGHSVTVVTVTTP
jgi:splicing factor 3B subunit 1